MEYVMSTPLDHTTRVHKALGHPARLRILAMLRGGGLCACQIATVLDLAPSTVSAHLGELRSAGFVTERKEGRWVHYRLRKLPGVRALLSVVWRQLDGDPQRSADAHLLQQLRAIPVEELCSVSLNLDKLAISREAVVTSGW